MTFEIARLTDRARVAAFGGGASAVGDRPAAPAPPPGVHGRDGHEEPGRVEAMARTLVPPAAASGGLALGLTALEATRVAPALKVARFANLLLATVLTGNGVGSLLFVHPALRELPPDAYFAAEQELTRRYPEVMRTLMPVTVVSGLGVLALLRDWRSAAFRLTLAGTACFVGVLGLTGLEIPLNKETLLAEPAAPPTAWPARRERWERFNGLRVLCEVAGWSALCAAALAGPAAKRWPGRR